MLIAGLVHDLGHDGFTNSYHQNAVTTRGISSNDNSIQETFHASELFKILAEPDCNIVEHLTRDQFKVFRKRVIGMILATDMAKHKADLTLLERSIIEHEIDPNREKLEMEVFRLSEVEKVFVDQQFYMECCLHACDVS